MTYRINKERNGR